ncbi:MAG: Pycsar system effector family protein [Saprospiraceae bacterium]
MSIVSLIEQHVTSLLTEKLSEGHTYHNLPHTLAVRKAVLELGRSSKMTDEELEILELSALLHDTGFTEKYTGHEAASVRIAQELLEAQAYPLEKMNQVFACIAATAVDRTPHNRLEEIIKDADLSNLGSDRYLEILHGLRQEWARMLGQHYSDTEWFELNHRFFKQHLYYTKAAQDLYSTQFELNQRRLKKLANPEKKKKELVPISENKSAQMMFKTALRNHLDLSSLADNKANIMLSINALILTITMPMAASYIKDNIFLLAPMILLMTSCLCSIVFATLATRPIRMIGYTDITKIKERGANLFFFGNFYEMELPEYKEGMRITVENEEILNDAIMRDLFFLGKSLGVKYRHLRICYTIFLTGIVTTVLVFGVCYLMYLAE